jgi:hypothetical protein
VRPDMSRTALDFVLAMPDEPHGQRVHTVLLPVKSGSTWRVQISRMARFIISGHLLPREMRSAGSGMTAG